MRKLSSHLSLLTIIICIYSYSCKSNISNIDLPLILSENSETPFKLDLKNYPIGNIKSMWLKADGTEGWAVSTNCTILHYDKTGRGWKVDTVSASSLNKLWMNADGTEGWAVGDDGTILHFDQNVGGWKKEGTGLTSDALWTLWMKADGTEGWAAGNFGIILHYEKTLGGWKKTDVDALSNSALSNLWMKADGSEGWAAGSDGAILHYDKTRGGWKAESVFMLGSLNSLWMKADGSEGWAVGDDGVIVHYDKNGGGWKKVGVVLTFLSLNSLWMNADGTEGWAAGNFGTILHYVKNAGGWKKEGARLSSGSLNTLWMKADGTEGWAAGSNGTLLHYDKTGGGWKKEGENSTDISLNTLRINADGTEGWAAGDNGIILHYDKTVGGWKKEVVGLNDNSLSKLWMKADGTEGWATGQGGTILHYDKAGGGWKKEGDGLTRLNLITLWMKGDGTEGWAAGDSGTILHYEKNEGEWKKEGVGLTNNFLYKLWMKVDGTEGWATGEGGAILHYDKTGGGWKKEGDGLTSLKLYDLWMKGDGTEGWAAGEGGIILRYDKTGGGWKIDDETRLTRRILTSLWMKADGTEGWAAGVDGIILHYDKTAGGWKVFARELPTGALYILWMKADGSEGWAASDYNQILHYEKNKGGWEIYGEGLSGSMFSTLWMNKEGTEGWASGNKGQMLHYQNNKWHIFDKVSFIKVNYFFGVDGPELFGVGDNGLICKIEHFLPARLTVKGLDPDKISDLSGQITFHFFDKIQSIESIKLAGLENLDFKKDTNYTIILDSTGYNASLNFKKTSDIGQRYLHNKFKLQFILKFSDAINAEAVSVETKEEFVIGGHSPEFFVFWSLVGLITINIVLVLLATQFRFFRWIVLHPVGSQVVSLVVGKYLITDFLIHFFSAIRLALFKGYRQGLKDDAPFIRKWRSTTSTYIPPTIAAEGFSKNEIGGEEWQQTGECILESPKNILWLVIGRSGLGKTALLEKWAALALAKKATPVFIRLGEQGSPISICHTAVQQYGDVIVKEDALLDIFKWGGFVFFIDGFNEAQQPAEAITFIRKVIKQNIVVLSGQEKPSNLNDINTKYIDLRPFGLGQLSKIIGDDWAAKAFEESHLSEILKLPQTAQLLAGYIGKNNKLPDFSLEVYSDLLVIKSYDQSKIDTIKNQLCLKAWELFASQGIAFDAENDILPAPECEALFNAGVLSKTNNSFRFRHERIHRYFVACYIFQEDVIDMTVWQGKLEKGQPKNYWADVIEFLGEMFVYRITAARGDESEYNQQLYHDFVLSVNEFSHPIFLKQTFPQYVDYFNAGLIRKDTEFYNTLVLKSLGR